MNLMVDTQDSQGFYCYATQGCQRKPVVIIL